MIIKDYYKESIELMLSLEFVNLDNLVLVHRNTDIFELDLDRFVNDFNSYLDYEYFPEWCDPNWDEEEALFIGSFISDLILLKIIKV